MHTLIPPVAVSARAPAVPTSSERSEAQESWCQKGTSNSQLVSKAQEERKHGARD